LADRIVSADPIAWKEYADETVPDEDALGRIRRALVASTGGGATAVSDNAARIRTLAGQPCRVTIGSFSTGAYGHLDPATVEVPEMAQARVSLDAVASIAANVVATRLQQAGLDGSAAAVDAELRAIGLELVQLDVASQVESIRTAYAELAHLHALLS